MRFDMCVVFVCSRDVLQMCSTLCNVKCHMQLVWDMEARLHLPRASLVASEHEIQMGRKKDNLQDKIDFINFRTLPLVCSAIRSPSQISSKSRKCLNDAVAKR